MLLGQPTFTGQPSEVETSSITLLGLLYADRSPIFCGPESEKHAVARLLPGYSEAAGAVSRQAVGQESAAAAGPAVAAAA